jgi:hypothetical protein
MAAANQEDLGQDDLRFRLEEEVSREFGAYRAEWMDERLFSLFREPRYLGSLMADQPMVLQGGRGTGKTTVLKGLSFRGVFARSGEDLESVHRTSFIGLYYKVMMSQVAPFKGAEVSDDQWTRLFSHYLNLIHCGLIVDYLSWLENQGTGVHLSQSAIEEIADSLGLATPESTTTLCTEISRAHRRFETFINNVAGDRSPTLSMLGVPQRLFAQAVLDSLELHGKRICFLIDEYENLSISQQRIFNTLIKEAGGPLTYKVGVREEGWSERETLNPAQRLEEPQDFRWINITQELSRAGAFPEFAAAVCGDRLARLTQAKPASIVEILPSLSEEDEADLLGVGPLASSVREKLLSYSDSADRRAAVAAMSDLNVYLLGEWATAHAEDLSQVFADFTERPVAWEERFRNYKHTLLYTIRVKKAGIRKYYAGWDTYCLLASCNIRFLLQLVETALRLHLLAEGSLKHGVSPAVQTVAAQEVGEKRLFDLESSSGAGEQILRLLLGLGRVFGQLAAGGSKHAPETNQFELSRRLQGDERLSDEEAGRLSLVMKDAVMNSALLRTAANKLQEKTDIADELFIVHPIFSPFFVFSYRRKRKMRIKPRQLLALIDDPSAAIGPLIDADLPADGVSSDDAQSSDLPDQMRLFAEYYRAA